MMYFCPNCKEETEVDIIEDGFFTYGLSSNGDLIRENFFPVSNKYVICIKCGNEICEFNEEIKEKLME